MLETLTNLKNNRVKSAPGGEAAAEATTRMKKFLANLEKKKHGPSRSRLSPSSPFLNTSFLSQAIQC
jgi:hypothetical protein